MYSLILFYYTCKKDLESYRPLPKFICVKMIIFLTFWQGMIVAFLVKLGFITGNETYSTNNMALAIQDLLITLEMPFFAIYHAYAFPWTDYDDSRLSSRLLLNWAFKDALGVKDIIQDAYHVFKGTLFLQNQLLKIFGMISRVILKIITMNLLDYCIQIQISLTPLMNAIAAWIHWNFLM